MTNNKKVLLTGITGFVGSHTAVQLLEKGYHVIGTLRDMKRAASIKSVIAKHTSAIDNLSFCSSRRPRCSYMETTNGGCGLCSTHCFAFS